MGDIIHPGPRLKTKIDRNTITDTEGAAKSKLMIKDAAKVFCPVDHEHQASVVLNFYRHKSPSKEIYTFIVQQIGMNGIPERQADAGYKEMMRTMQGNYREPPKTRTDV